MTNKERAEQLLERIGIEAALDEAEARGRQQAAEQIFDSFTYNGIYTLQSIRLHLQQFFTSAPCSRA